jgi:hypothetical protein
MKEKVALYLLFITGLAIVTDWITQEEPIDYQENFQNTKVYFPKPTNPVEFYKQEKHYVDWDNVKEREKHPLPRKTEYIFKEGNDAYKFDTSQFSTDISPYDCSDIFCKPLTLTK